MTRHTTRTVLALLNPTEVGDKQAAMSGASAET